MEFSNEWQTLKIKLLETANQLSGFLTERFNISTEKQMAFLNNSVSNSGTQAIALLKITLYSLSESIFYLLNQEEKDELQHHISLSRYKKNEFVQVNNFGTNDHIQFHIEVDLSHP